ncbi:MAG: hypothetical protein WCV79_04110 [Candidatus Paceibacterota bacterium]|jgi:hypothetical protein
MVQVRSPGQEFVIRPEELSSPARRIAEFLYERRNEFDVEDFTELLLYTFSEALRREEISQGELVIEPPHPDISVRSLLLLLAEVKAETEGQLGMLQRMLLGMATTAMRVHIDRLAAKQEGQPTSSQSESLEKVYIPKTEQHSIDLAAQVASLTQERDDLLSRIEEMKERRRDN